LQAHNFARRPTDAVREYVYNRQSKVGKLDKALDEATAKSRTNRRRETIVDMKSDWKKVFAFEP
jgi:hypothetical protein